MAAQREADPATPIDELYAGLDWNTSCAAALLLGLYLSPTRKDDLLRCEKHLTRAIALKTHVKHACVSRAAARLRHGFIEKGAGKVELDVLNVLEAYNASVAVRKLLDIVREESFRLRQMSFDFGT